MPDPAAAPTTPITAPPHPFLPDTPWPTFHLNNYAQAATPLRGPEPGDRCRVQLVRTDSASSWIQLTPRYPDGSRVVWGATLNTVFKLRVAGERFDKIAEVPLPRRTLSDSFLLRDGRYVTCHNGERALMFYRDRDKGDPAAPILLDGRVTLAPEAKGPLAHIALSYDGWIVCLSRDGYLGAVRLSDGKQAPVYRIPREPDEVFSHNSFPLDEDGFLFLVGTRSMVCVRWTGTDFRPVWRVPFDFLGVRRRRFGFQRQKIATLTGQPGSGSGTTPTLMGTRGQRLVAMVDSWEPNRMILFWSHEIPADWRGLPGYDRRVADVLPLPYSTPTGRGFTAENSPCAWGDEIACAQWNGFFPGRDPLRGVQKLRWDDRAGKLAVAWATDAVNMNGVLTYSRGSGLVYQSGTEDGVHHFYGLDWRTGRKALSVPLGRGKEYLDQGNQVVIDDDRSALFSGGGGVIRVLPT